MIEDGVVRRVALGALIVAALVAPGAAAVEIKDCTNAQEREIAEAIDFAVSRWNEFEVVLEQAADVNIKNCLENRFKRNGKVVCEKKDKGSCKGNYAWASPLNRRCHLCPTLLDAVAGRSVPDDRKACYLANVTHEWAHTCERTHKSIETIDNAALDFWKSKNPAATVSAGVCVD